VSTSTVFSFPNPVNEVAARAVAAGVVVMAVCALAFRQYWLLIPLAYGFLARVFTGPKLSPLGQMATKVVAPRLSERARLVPGPPKRFAQAIGATLTVAASVLYFGFGAVGAAQVLLAMLVVAAFLEAALAVCLGCKIFAVLMRIGIVPTDVCEECNNFDKP
jgi:hypothetical protein